VPNGGINMRKRLHFIVLCFFALLIVIFSNPTISAAIPSGTYYVDIGSGTDDVGYGTSSGAGAWKTLHYAVDQINNGSPGTYILNVAAGTYSVGNGEDDLSLTITQDNVTIQGAGAGNTIIDGTTSVSAWFTGIKIDASTGNVTIKDLDVKVFSYSGIAIYSGTGNIIEGCEVHNNGSVGIYIENSSPVIKQNRIYDNPTGISIIADTSDCSPNIKRNKIEDNDTGIFIEGYGGAASPTIWNNIIYPLDSPIQNGIGVNDNASPSIYHNTID